MDVCRKRKCVNHVLDGWGSSSYWHIIVIHAEMPVHTEGKPDPRGLQLGVDLPKQVRLDYEKVISDLY